MHGQDGKDQLFGGNDQDLLTGGAGNYSLSGELDGSEDLSTDLLFGGLGADKFHCYADFAFFFDNESFMDFASSQGDSEINHQ